MPADELEQASRILQAEARDGLRDRVVIGGLAGYMRNFLDAVTRSADRDAQRRAAEAVALLEGYATLAPEERAVRVGSARTILQGTQGTPPPGPLPTGGGDTSSPSGASPPSPRPAREQTVGRGVGMTLETPIASLRGVGPQRARLYARLGLATVRDLLFHFPTRHQAFPPARPIAELVFQTEGSVVGSVERVEVESLPRGLKKLKVTVRDPSGTITAAWLRHGTPRIGLREGDPVALSGKLTQVGRHLTFDSPDYERADGPRIHTRGLVPVYPLTAGLIDRELRSRIHWAVTHFADDLSDPLPAAVRERQALLAIADALRRLHFPATAEQNAEARRRFAFEELLTIQLVVLQRRMSAGREPAPRLPTARAALDALTASLPFALTPAQQRVTAEILNDVAGERPMTRLLQGEVGSGKTAVAAMALLNAVANGYQAAIMAPTEILAEQHFATLSRTYGDAADDLRAVIGHAPTVALLTGSVKGRERTATYAAAGDGSLDVVVGTQALIQEGVEFARLGLVIVDEQHRFGVRQRMTLRQRTHADLGQPHLLVMTATPIPRTLALSLYGDLDLSVIDGMPPGRQPPRTILLGPDDREMAYERVRRAVARGQQAFIICPLVEESEVLEARSATEEFERLQSGELADLRLALLHGRMKPNQKDAIMRSFRDNEVDVLVSTAVVEVGVDVPNATVMLIEGAERFGLAQLHQFRGRIGRGQEASVCILLSEQADPRSNERLQVVERSSDGLALAEHDLRLRGPGDYFGVRQSGFPDLKVARLDDAPLVEAARGAAADILAADPQLEQSANADLRAHLEAFLARAGEPS